GDVAPLVGVEKIVGGHDVLDGSLELVEVTGPVEAEERLHGLEFAVPVSPLLADGNSTTPPHHRTVDASQHGEGDRGSPANVDRLDARLEWAARAVEHVPRVAASAGVAEGFEVVIEVVTRGGVRAKAKGPGQKRRPV